MRCVLVQFFLCIVSAFFVLSCHSSSGESEIKHYGSSHSSSADSPYPLTKTKVKSLLQKAPDPKGQQLLTEILHGCVSVPAKGFFQNLLVGSESTGESCTVTVKPKNTVAISFLRDIDIPLVDTSTKEYSTDIFLNEIEDNGLVIIQHVKGKVVSATHTTYDQKGYAIYAGYGKGNFIKSCVFRSQTTEQQNCHSKN